MLLWKFLLYSEIEGHVCHYYYYYYYYLYIVLQYFLLWQKAVAFLSHELSNNKSGFTTIIIKIGRGTETEIPLSPRLIKHSITGQTPVASVRTRKHGRQSCKVSNTSSLEQRGRKTKQAHLRLFDYFIACHRHVFVVFVDVTGRRKKKGGGGGG